MTTDPEILRIPILNRDHWQSLRTNDVTASDVAAVCGIVPSRAKVWGVKKGILPPTEETNRLRAGRWFEPAAFEALAEVYPRLEVRRAKVYLRDSAARLGATPDAVAIDPDRDGIGIIEAKNVLPQIYLRDWCGGDNGAQPDPPFAYKLQTLTQAMLAGASWAAIVVLVNNPYDPLLRLIPVERHPGAEAMIRERVAAFWRDYMDPNVCPPLDPEHDDDLVKRLYPRDDGGEIDLTGDNRIMHLVDELTATKGKIKKLDKYESTLKTEIAEKLGTATYARLSDGRCLSYKLQNHRGYYVAPSSFRTIRILQR